MKVIILAGGLGTRLQEETIIKPKPMVEIGGKPILWHIMKIYDHYNHRDFGIAMGYKSDMIKDYFLNYYYQQSNLSIDLKNGNVTVHEKMHESWKVHLMDTGVKTQTGGRLRYFKDWLGNEPFLMTYGDGVSNVDVNKLVHFHKSTGKLVTLTAVRPPSRFGGLVLENDQVVSFNEKPQIGEGWINGGFFVIEPEALDYIEDDSTPWERAPLETICAEGKLAAYKHEGYWQCMDTIRELQLLEHLWSTGDAPWRMWS